MVDPMSEKGIYVKLPIGVWVRIKGKISRIITSRSKGRKTISYTLLGESLEEQPQINDEPHKTYYISSTRVTKYILRLLDETNTRKYLMIIEPLTKETYRISYWGDKKELTKAIQIAEDMKILKTPPQTQRAKKTITI